MLQSLICTCRAIVMDMFGACRCMICLMHCMCRCTASGQIDSRMGRLMGQRCVIQVQATQTQGVVCDLGTKTDADSVNIRKLESSCQASILHSARMDAYPFSSAQPEPESVERKADRLLRPYSWLGVCFQCSH